ncbi:MULTISPECIES: polysaccharide deacetylase family protein [Rhizobium]|uniref:Chitooligosaccharide deacetylase n=1 Tax=Rhizobium paranaense TaxID=1650438 RepID=A0A7W9D1W6_9HYPH|nr:polysaccharide deacetylase [Rhizobium paranaense]MBB5574638.1 peptidoglycan/xylan/chitin deacetylase (PgdA/CDA1 family) [Rhizobium paranaense]
MRIPPYSWPVGKACAVAVQVLFDDGLDAVFKAPDLVNRSKSFSVWEYGAKRGVERLADTLQEMQVPATWFVPGVVAEKHESLLRNVAGRGHELAARGWAFERYDSLPAQQALERLKRSVAALADLTGTEPRGFRLPAGNWPAGFDGLLLRAGFEWSATLSGDDRPYFHRSGLVEIPVHLELEDRPYFQFNFNPPFPKGLSRLPSYDSVLRNWKAEFDAYRKYGLCFVLQIRPEMIGTPGRIFILRELLAYVRSFDDVWIARSSEIADWHRSHAQAVEDGHPIEVYRSYRRENGLHD